MTRNAQRLAATVVIAVAVTLATTVGAWASPPLEASSPLSTSHSLSVDPLARPTIIRTTAGNGFDFGDAAIGAGFGFALSMLGLGAALTISQHRPRRHEHVGTSGATGA
jgi:hypothetical protein